MHECNDENSTAASHVPNRFSRHGRGAAIGAISLIAAVTGLSGCGFHERPLPDEQPFLEVELIHPSEGDTVAGEVPLEAALRGNRTVARVRFLADGQPLDTVDTAPWKAVWPADPAVVRSARLQAEAAGDGWSIRSAEKRVWVLPDSAPAVALRLPGNALWIERRPGVSLEAAAADPEEGILDGGRILWTGDRLRRPFHGPSLPVEFLTEEEQTIEAAAADRWGRTGSARVRIRPFSYHPADGPEVCLENLAASIRSRDPAGLLRQADSCFVFVPCAEQADAAGWEAVWGESIFAPRVTSWLGDPAMTDLLLGWAAGPPRTWGAGGLLYAWISIAGIRITFSIVSEGAKAEVAIVDAGADMLLVRRPGGDWNVLEWRDLPGSRGPSLASLLAERSGLRRAPDGARCGRDSRRMDTGDLRGMNPARRLGSR